MELGAGLHLRPAAASVVRWSVSAPSTRVRRTLRQGGTGQPGGVCPGRLLALRATPPAWAVSRCGPDTSRGVCRPHAKDAHDMGKRVVASARDFRENVDAAVGERR